MASSSAKVVALGVGVCTPRKGSRSSPITGSDSNASPLLRKRHCLGARRRFVLISPSTANSSGAGSKGTLFINGEKVGEGKIAKTIPNTISLYYTAEAGRDEGTPVTEDYKVRENSFTGRIRKATISIK